jgi:hypothetical protein
LFIVSSNYKLKHILRDGPIAAGRISQIYQSDMVHQILLTALVTNALPLAIAVAMDGAEWRFLLEFLDSTKNSPDPTALRSAGTFWNAEKARYFATNPDMSPGPYECEVWLYYP